MSLKNVMMMSAVVFSLAGIGAESYAQQVPLKQNPPPSPVQTQTPSAATQSVPKVAIPMGMPGGPQAGSPPAGFTGTAGATINPPMGMPGAPAGSPPVIEGGNSGIPMGMPGGPQAGNPVPVQGGPQNVPAAQPAQQGTTAAPTTTTPDGSASTNNLSGATTPQGSLSGTPLQ